jgi:hypothetical protein
LQIVALPKSVNPSHIEENFQRKLRPSFSPCEDAINNISCHVVPTLREDAFGKMEDAADHEPHRVVNPSKSWGLDFDIFDY